jgi:hypothetical protein
LEMIQRKMSLFPIEKISYNELYNNWNYTNEQKRNNISNKFLIKLINKALRIRLL